MRDFLLTTSFTSKFILNKLAQLESLLCSLKTIILDIITLLIIKNKNDEIVNVNSAHFLIIRGFIQAILEKNELKMNDLMEEVMGKYWDSKYWDTRRQKVLNKHARKNNCIAKDEQVADYSKGKGTIY